MYSRYHDRPVRVPENYGGVVFSDTSAAKETPPHRMEVAMPTPPRHSERKEIAVIPPPKTLRLSPQNDETEASLRPSEDRTCGDGTEDASERKASHAPEVGGLPFLKGMRFDDLLLLSLILLLSQSDTDSDVVLWLALLLFCG